MRQAFIVEVDTEGPVGHDAEMVKQALDHWLQEWKASVAVAHHVGVIRPAHGDPEAFGEREAVLDDAAVQGSRYGARLFAEVPR